VTILPLIAQALFLLLQATKQGRQSVALPLGINDGWMVVLVLSAMPSLFENDLGWMASPALQVLNGAPSLSLKLAIGLSVARALFSRQQVITRRDRASHRILEDSCEASDVPQ
jgi:hypothetical protein